MPITPEVLFVGNLKELTEQKKKENLYRGTLLYCSWVIVQGFTVWCGPQRNELKLLVLNSRIQTFNISTSWVLASECINVVMF